MCFLCENRFHYFPDQQIKILNLSFPQWFIRGFKNKRHIIKSDVVHQHSENILSKEPFPILFVSVNPCGQFLLWIIYMHSPQVLKSDNLSNVLNVSSYPSCDLILYPEVKAWQVSIQIPTLDYRQPFSIINLSCSNLCPIFVPCPAVFSITAVTPFVLIKDNVNRFRIRVRHSSSLIVFQVTPGVKI